MKVVKERTRKEVLVQRDCSFCGKKELATNRVTFLLENARRNPVSSGYNGDDISRCSDLTKYACEECKNNRDCYIAPKGYSWAGLFYMYNDEGKKVRELKEFCVWKVKR